MAAIVTRVKLSYYKNTKIKTMKKIQLGILTLGLGFITINSLSSFTNRADSLYGNDNGTWKSLEGFTEAEDPENVQPGEYACLGNQDVCTAEMETPSDPPENERPGHLIINEP